MIVADESAVPEADRWIEVSDEERHEMIAVAAYYLAERRGFVPGGECGDWYEAAAAVDGMLEAMRRAGVTRRQYERVGLRNALKLWSG
jgi:hypothetical protein